MGDNVDQNANTFMEQLQLPLHLQDWVQQQQASALPALGDANRPHMFYRDHQNLYNRGDYIEEQQEQVYPHDYDSYNNQYFESFQEEPAYYGYEQSYQEWQWQYQDPYQPPQPEYQEPYPPERDDWEDEVKGMIQQLLANTLKSDERVEELASKIDALTSHINKLDTQLAWNAEAIESWSENLNVITPESDTQLLSHEQTPTKVPKVMDLDDLDEFSDLGKFNHAGNKDKQISSALIVVLNDQINPELTQVPPQHVYIHKVQYPNVVFRLKVPTRLKKPSNPVECGYKSKFLGKLFSFVALYSDVMLWKAKPTCHTMPWFEEVVTYLASQSLDELSRVVRRKSQANDYKQALGGRQPTRYYLLFFYFCFISLYLVLLEAYFHIEDDVI